MTNEDAIKKLKAKLKCMKNETSGINQECNRRLCEGCSLLYEQGNNGEQQESLDMSIKALEIMDALEKEMHKQIYMQILLESEPKDIDWSKVRLGDAIDSNAVIKVVKPNDE